MNAKLLAAAAALSLIVASSVEAGSLAPELQEAVDQSDGQGRLPVIIQFVEGVDTPALRLEAGRIARALHPNDPTKRSKERRKLLRKKLIEALKAQSKDTKKQVNAFLKSRGEKPKLTLLWARNAVAGNLPVDLLEDVAELPGVEEVRMDATVQGPEPSAAPTAPTEWNLDATGVKTLWNLGFAGQGVVVASLDTGVDASHPDLGPRWRGGSNSWFDPTGTYSAPADTNGHGTQTMGLIVAGAASGRQIGMAPDAQWIAAKIFDAFNEATTSGIHAAYQWALDPDGNANTDDAPDILNNSWDLSNTVNQCNQEFAADLALLAASDIAVAFAGGNYGPHADTSVSPANDPSVLAVGGVDRNLVVDTQSSRGPGACDGGIYPHLVAPGDGVLTTDRMPSFLNTVSGTSFAVAHVAGGMAVLKSAFPDATASQLWAAVVETAVETLGDLVVGPDNTYGSGLMDVAAAFESLGGDLGVGPPGSLALSSGTYSVDENVPTLTVTVTRTGGSGGDVSIDYATEDGSAVAGEDYVATSGTLTLANGEVSGHFTVTLLNDDWVEGDEYLTVALTNPVAATLDSPESAQVNILDDDAPSGDADGDGSFVPADCDDTDASIYPDADEIERDGIDQDCNGYDLTIEITSANYDSRRGTLSVVATSDLESDADLSVVGYGAMRWDRKSNRWTFSARKVPSNPGTVTVEGVEGATTALVR